MKTVAQWAEQLPELIRIEFLKECKKHELNLKRKRENLSGVFWLSFWWLESYTELGSEFWQFVRNELNDETNYYDYLDESVPYTKEEVEAMILEYADPNDEVCKVMLANVGKTKEATLANQLTYEALSLSNKNLIIEIGEITKENEALKSTIEGLNAIVKTQTLEFAQLKSAKDQLNLDMYPLHRKLNEAKGKLELAEKRIIELNKEINSSFFNRFLNWILS